jgi:four helix bundle protein
MQNFRNLKVWEKGHALTLAVYQATKSFPRDEIYGLTSQMRRASASIGANIAEGSCHNGDVDFARFLQIAAGSASELENHLLLAHNLDLLETSDYQRLSDGAISDGAIEVKRMLASLMQKLRANG